MKLRHQTISFVAAGSTTPLEFKPKPSLDEADADAAERTAKDSDDEEVGLGQEAEQGIEDSVVQTNVVDTDVEVSEGGIAQMNLHSSGEMSEQDTGPTSSDVDMSGYKEAEPAVEMEVEQEQLFVVDTAGDAALAPPAGKAKAKRPTKRAPSPPPSDLSSDDEVVFSGRGRPKTIDDPFKVQRQPTKSRQAQQTQQPSAQARPDPLAAWNQAARTLSQQYKNQLSAPTGISNDKVSREDTTKETFKKATGSQGLPGGPRKYEAVEHSIHHAQGSRSADADHGSTDLAGQTNGAADDTARPHVADDLLRALSVSATETAEDQWSPSDPKARGWGASRSKADREVNTEAVWAPAPAGSWWRQDKKQPRPDLDMSAEEKAAIDQSPPKLTKIAFTEPGSSKQAVAEVISKAAEEVEEGSKEDIELLQANWKQTLRDKKRAKLSKREADVVPLDSPKPGSSRRSKRGARKKDNRALRAAIESDDDDDEAGEAAYDDYMANLAAQMESNGGEDATSSFAQSNGLGGPSMVVNGQAVGDDEVLKGHSATMNGDDEDEWESESDEPIGQDVSDLSNDEQGDYEDILDSSDLEDELEYDEREMWEDEEDLRERRKQAMDDEQLAHLLAKQQEFGIDGDDLVLDNGFGMDGLGDIDEARAGLANMTNIVNGSQKTKKSHRSGGRKDVNFPDASALADTVDQYGDAGFDIMDFDRPSLRPTKKGRKGKLPAELETLSDDEMKENMSAAWENDRAKKRLKKAEREELRSQGMLGAMGKKGKADLTEKYKYQDGMSATQIMDELRVFMKDERQESRPFPPMDAYNRKRLHEMAYHLNLKSKSVGAGKSRFPVLYKTSQTLEFDERLFAATMRDTKKDGMAVNVKFAKRAKKMAGKGPGGRGGGKGGGGMAAASVGHGEIVGANAPEIGVENKGFKFMQKMGWTPGMSLGREGEGRLRPVEQMMRVGRAGLG